MDPALSQAIFRIKDHSTFRETALEVFYYQSARNPVYGEYLRRLGVDAAAVTSVEEIPFLPVEFFKTHTVLCEGLQAEMVFESSGTTQLSPARHHIADPGLYRKSFTEGFRLFYGAPEDYCILALLPSYMERSGSSLVYMMDHLIQQSGHPESGFYLGHPRDLSAVLQKRNQDLRPTLLLGVSFALLDLAEHYPMKLGDHITVMETGGMKGKRRELIRSELHEQLIRGLGVNFIHSEYGMTELLSQGYSAGRGHYRCPPWMKVMTRDPNDPLTLLAPGQTGGINIIDLANLYSCAFLATGDLGKVRDDGSFEVLGRFDQSDIRGCNLLVP